MRFPSKETVERIRSQYPKGTRVELIHMDDIHNVEDTDDDLLVGTTRFGEILEVSIEALKSLFS